MSNLSPLPGPIGIFDSGYGGLTILHGIRQLLPEYDYLYLGDNARTPYGPRSFEVVYEFTRQAVMKLFEMGCHLIILGCNTASAKALRTIQQNDLPLIDPERRVLGIIRLVYFFLGADLLRGTWVQTAFMSLTLFTVFMGSLMAYREGLLKKRLAYSSVSQVSYVLFGLSTLHPLGFVGALLHVLAHSLIKDSLFMSAGAIIHRTGKTRVSELEGIGKQMPAVMWCFTLVSVGLVGIPPCLGFVSKWYLAQGALAMDGVAGFFRYLAPAVLLISALLTAGYLLTVSIRGFFPGHGEDGKPKYFEKNEPGLTMLIPLGILTALSVLLGLFPTALIDLFTGITAAIF